jgi:hypothetical protein
MTLRTRLYACRCACFIVGPLPQATSTTPEVPVTSHSPPTLFTSSMWMPSRFGVLNRITESLEVLSKVSASLYGKGGTTMRTPIWNPLRARRRVGLPSARLWRSSPMGVSSPSCWMLIAG